MAGIIIYIPPVIPTPPINPTSTLMPVKSGSTFVDSNIKNVVDEYIETKNSLNEFIGLRVNFFDNTSTLGNLTTCNIAVSADEVSMNGNLVSEPLVAFGNKYLKIVNNGDVYYIPLSIEI
jgi:hypothetical protein